jgi:hypothetical protein
VARSICLEQEKLDCELCCTHIRGRDNLVVDLLSRWISFNNSVSNDRLEWAIISENIWFLDEIFSDIKGQRHYRNIASPVAPTDPFLSQRVDGCLNVVTQSDLR